MRRGVVPAVAIIAAALVACSTPPLAPLEPRGPRDAPPSVAAPADAAVRGPVIERPKSRWIPVAWDAVPGWRDDRASDIWPALLASCAKPQPAWAPLCSDARGDAWSLATDDRATREWLEARVVPHRIEARDGAAEGLATGYFEPLLDASRTPRPGFRTPLHAPPADLASKRPYWTRKQLDTIPEAQQALRGREIAWLRDPIDLLLLQIQGSGRLRFATPGRAGEASVVRVAFAGHNDHPYRSVGRWLADTGELKLEQASWPAIRRWAERNPQRVDELVWTNPRVVFFREEPLADPRMGPKGAEGVPLTPGRSIAVDPQSVPYGSLVWLDTTAPLSALPLRRLAMAQDTGSAITGAVRADYFWGWGETAEAEAGRMKQPLRMWVLVPRRSPVSAP